MMGKTSILAKKQRTKAKYILISLSRAYGIPNFASPKGEMLHSMAITISRNKS